MPEIVLVRANDWEGFYIDGLLWAENHSVDSAYIVEMLGGKVQHLTSEQDKALCQQGGLPNCLADIPTQLVVETEEIEDERKT